MNDNTTKDFIMSQDISHIYPLQGENSDTPYATLAVKNSEIMDVILLIRGIRSIMSDDYVLGALLADALERGWLTIEQVEEIADNTEKIITILDKKSEKEWITVQFPIFKKTEQGIESLEMSIRAPGYSYIVEGLRMFLSDKFIQKLEKIMVPEGDEWNSFNFETGEYKKS